MKVQDILSKYNNQICNPSFGSFSREVMSKNFLKKELLYRNDTWFFRDSEFWAQLTTFLVSKFKDASKAQVYCYGCSDGSEPYTFAMRMLSSHSEDDVKKFLPVIAKDIDKFVIKKAKSQECYFFRDHEIQDINYYAKQGFDRFFRSIDTKFAYPSQELFSSVEFSVADIFKDYKNISPDNSIVLMRNFWPYINDSNRRQKLLNNLGKHLQKNSFIVIGDYDMRGTNFTLTDQILKAGFKTTSLPYVFEKDNI